MKSFLKRPTWVIVLVLAGAAECGALGHVWVRMQVVALGYDIAREKQVAEQLVRQNQRLRIETDWLRNPSRVESIVMRDLNMGPVDPGHIRVLAHNPKDRTGAARDVPRELAKR